MDKEQEKTLNRINKDTKVGGLPFVYMMVFIALASFPFVTSLYLLILDIPLFIWLVKKFKTANKRGCPDYITEISNNISIAVEFKDQTNVMNKL